MVSHDAVASDGPFQAKNAASLGERRRYSRDLSGPSGGGSRLSSGVSGAGDPRLSLFLRAGFLRLSAGADGSRPGMRGSFNGRPIVGKPKGKGQGGGPSPGGLVAENFHTIQTLPWLYLASGIGIEPSRMYVVPFLDRHAHLGAHQTRIR